MKTIKFFSFKIIKQICYFVLPIALVTVFILHITLNASWSTTVFSIVLATSAGFFTNTIAVIFLFWPYGKKFGIQGIIPAKRNELALNISQSLKDKFFTSDIIHSYIYEEIDITNNIEKLEPYIENMLKNHKIFQMPILNNKKIITMCAKIICTQIKDQQEKIINKQTIKKILNSIEVEKLIEKEIQKMSSKEFAQSIRKAADENLSAIEVLGAVLGALIGCLFLLV